MKNQAILIIALMVLIPALTVTLNVSGDGQSGTTVSAYKTATGFHEEVFTYDWTVLKSVDPTSLTLANGAGSVSYTITATRTLASDVVRYGVRGQICVTNGGAVATENLMIVDQVLYKSGGGPYGPLTGATQIISVPGELAAGASMCYNYEIIFTPIAGAQYKNSVQVTITNHSGHLGEAFGPNPDAGFTLPATITPVYVDDSASVSEVETCPPGFTCTPDYGTWGDPPWTLTDSATISFTKDITAGAGVDCDTYYTLPNTVTLTESTTEQTHQSSASVSIYTGPCAGGCTLTVGFWKNHAGLGPQPDYVTQFLPIWLGTSGGAKSVQVTTAAGAASILGVPDSSSNGISKLYAQLLAAKLNIANGADGSAVASTIADADAFLATHDSGDWTSLSPAEQTTVLGWMTTLDNYNNGLIGPGHCTLTPPPP
jgi:hypothetical protein